MSRSHKGLGRWLFATNFLKHPGMIGSVVPSSRYLVERMLEPIDWRRTERIIEYGPGEGTFTRQILDRMGPDARLLLIELNADLAAYLKREFNDPRLTVVHGSAADVNRILAEQGWDDGADYAISGIPFSTIPEALRTEILRETRACLRPGGEFIVFQFSSKVFRYLKQTFDAVEKAIVLRNFPPAQCYRCSFLVEEAAAEDVERRAAQA